MACIARYTLLLIFITFIPAFSAVVVHEMDGNSLVLKVTFDKGYSNVNTLKLDKSYVISFETTDELQFEQTFWDMPLSDVMVTSDGSRKRLIANFGNDVVVPEVISQENLLKITFAFKEAMEEVPSVTTQSYARMVWGLLIILAIVFVLLWLVKALYKKQMNTEVPGLGFLLGRVDLDVRKSVYFYEVDDTVYVLASTDSSMNLIDKIEDEDKISRIKAGFSKKSDFKAYMKFFSKNPSVKDEVNISRNTINERLESLRKR
jgi:flagellar biogenesis protein FliO